MKNITIYFPYYNSKDLLIFNLNHYSKMSEKILKKIYIFIVDDGSQKYPAYKILKNNEDNCKKLNITLYRINIDIPWNTPEANNLAFDKIKTNNVIRSDIDHIYSEKILNNILERKILNNRILFFKKRRLIDYNYNIIKILKPGRNIYIINKTAYNKINGYNEYFSGNYGDDLDFLQRAESILTKRIPLIVNEVLINSGTKNLSRDLTINLKKLEDKNRPFLKFVNKEHYILKYDHNLSK